MKWDDSKISHSVLRHLSKKHPAKPFLCTVQYCTFSELKQLCNMFLKTSHWMAVALHIRNV